jgi:uncharacterized protein YjbI with pentapeptide repeats
MEIFTSITDSRLFLMDERKREGKNVANQEQLELLKSDGEKWNRWREEHTQEIINLSGADLSGADLSRTDLSHANLSRTNLSAVSLQGTFLFNSNLSDTNLYNDPDCQGRKFLVSKRILLS